MSLCVVVADETGLVKRVEFELGAGAGGEGQGEGEPVLARGAPAKLVRTWGKQARTVEGVERLAWWALDAEQVVAARRDGSVAQWDSASGGAKLLRAARPALAAASASSSSAAAAAAASKTKPPPAANCCGVGAVVAGAAAAELRLLTCSGEGRVLVTDAARVYAGDAGDADALAAFSVGAAASFFRIDPLDLSRAASGGKDVHLGVWDLEKRAAVYKARNLPHDHLDMAHPVWPTDAAWTGPHTLVVGTGFNEVQLYDVRAGGPRRPVRHTKLRNPEETNRHINCVCAVESDPSLVVTADTYGNVCVVETGAMRETCRLSGATGSVRALASAGSYVVTGSLDRYVRVYDVRNHALLTRVFAKQRVTGVLCKLTGHAPSAAAAPEDEDDEDEDERVGGEGEGVVDEDSGARRAEASRRKNRGKAGLGGSRAAVAGAAEGDAGDDDDDDFEAWVQRGADSESDGEADAPPKAAGKADPKAKPKPGSQPAPAPAPKAKAKPASKPPPPPSAKKSKLGM